MPFDSQQSRAAIRALHDNLQKVTAPHVLLIEDEFVDAEVLRRSLRDAYPNVHLEWRDNAESAISTAVAFQFHLILLDLRFAVGMSGVEIFKSIRAKVNIPTFALTGLNRPAGLITEAMDAGIEVFFKKPLSRESMDLLFSAPT